MRKTGLGRRAGWGGVQSFLRASRNWFLPSLCFRKPRVLCDGLFLLLIKSFFWCVFLEDSRIHKHLASAWYRRLSRFFQQPRVKARCAWRLLNSVHRWHVGGGQSGWRVVRGCHLRVSTSVCSRLAPGPSYSSSCPRCPQGAYHGKPLHVREAASACFMLQVSVQSLFFR